MTEIDLIKALKVAKNAALQASQLLLAGYQRDIFSIKYKNKFDLVTEYDLKSERIIKEIILKAFPAHQIIAEESGFAGKQSSPYIWYIDPLDGTTNFAHKHPYFAVSIALTGPTSKSIGSVKEKNQPLVAVVQAPILGDLFFATYQQGAYFKKSLANNIIIERKLHVSQTSSLDKALLATGFPYDITENPLEVLNIFTKVISKCQAIRRDGAAALDLAYTALGVLDGFWESGLKPWDTAAGILLVSEAGGQISDFYNNEYSIGQTKNILATNKKIHKALLNLMATEKN